MLLKKDGSLIGKKRDLKAKKILISGNAIYLYMKNTNPPMFGSKATLVILKMKDAMNWQ